MASSPGKWEVVGKGGKPRKNNSGNKKNKSKVNEADLPKLDIKAPIPESKTQFDAFAKNKETPFVIPKEGDDINVMDDHVEHQTDFYADTNKKPEKIKRKQPKEPQQSLEEIIAQLLKKCDLSSIEDFISEIKEKYPSNGLVLLKELTGFLQSSFEGLSVEKDPVLGQQSLEFPLCCLATDVEEAITDELKECSEDEIDKFFSYCIEELLIEINKGRATYGIRMMIQCCLKCSPAVVLKSEKQYLHQVVSRKSNPREALSLLWVLGQTADHEDLVDRLSAWSSCFLPAIEFKQLSKYVVEYLEVTLSIPLPDKFRETPLTGKDFQRIMEIAYGSNYVQFPYRRQLQLLYPELKVIAFKSRPPSSLTDIFSNLFDSLNSDLGKEYRQEALRCLVECLEKDATCHHKWRNNYLVHLKESSLLLKALVEQWESVCRSIPRKYLVETLQEFQLANKEFKEREKAKAGLLECEASCQTLLDVISGAPVPSFDSTPSRFSRIAKLLTLILVSVVLVDMYRHNGYEGSETCKVLRRCGVEKILSKTYDHGKVYARGVGSWMESHYPHHYKKVVNVVEPASDYAIEKLGEGLYFMANVTAPAREFIHENVPPLLEKFEGFVSYCFNRVWKIVFTLWRTYFPIIKRYSQRAWDTIAIWVPFAWSRARQISANTTQWIYALSPDFFDAIGDGFRQLTTEVITRTPRILALVEEYLLAFWKLVISCIMAVVHWMEETVFRSSAG